MPDAANEVTTGEKNTPWLKIQVLSMAAGLSYMGSSLTAFSVVLRDKDSVGPGGISILLLAMLLPNILMAPVSGQIADRFPSRTVMPLALISMSLSSLSIALIPESWWAPFALFITATFGAMVGAASSATVGFVSKPEDMTRVAGIQTTYVSLGSLLGPAAGGVLVGTTGFFWPFVIDSVSFLILAIVFLSTGLNRPSMHHVIGEKPRALDGFRFIFKHRLLRSIMVILIVMILALGAISVGEVFLVVDELGADAITFGIIGALFAGGSLVGAIALQALKLKESRQVPGLLIAMSLAVTSFALLGLAQSILVVAIVYFLAGVGNAGINVFAIGQIQRAATEAVRGRIMAAVQGSLTAGNVTSLGMGGILIGAFGVRPVFVTAGVVALIALAILGPQMLRAARQK